MALDCISAKSTAFLETFNRLTKGWAEGGPWIRKDPMRWMEVLVERPKTSQAESGCCRGHRLSKGNFAGTVHEWNSGNDPNSAFATFSQKISDGVELMKDSKKGFQARKALVTSCTGRWME